ncbi:hypothetical protein [Mesorhizobium japonicum]|uniref:hypothetical protein n=1 Tax=Mesorhizobium japonicum TaxID=2066070 RepID=UPI0012FF4582|nr:hypothetical protein [Mesorhizobium japonicum]
MLDDRLSKLHCPNRVNVKCRLNPISRTYNGRRGALIIKLKVCTYAVQFIADNARRVTIVDNLHSKRFEIRCVFDAYFELRSGWKDKAITLAQANADNGEYGGSETDQRVR